MIIGLSLAIATHVRPTHWPELIAVYQIDRPAMLKIADDIWNGIRDEMNHHQLDLGGLDKVMGRTQIQCVPVDGELDLEHVKRRQDAERWLTAIHVVYEDPMTKINGEMRSLCDRLDPHVRIRTAPSFKKRYLGAEDELRPIDRCLGGSLCLEGSAPCITSLRRALRNRTGTPLSALADRYLNGDVRWTGNGGDEAPYAMTVCGPGVKHHA